MNINMQTENIYNHLCDDLSKRIFENRLLHSLTKNYDFIDNVVSCSFRKAELQEFRDVLNSNFEKYNDKNIIVYGAGFWGKQFTILCDKVKITAFCDSDVKKQGVEYMGYSVISPEQILQKYNDAIIIIAVMNDNVAIEITENLINIGVKKDFILNFAHIYKLNNTHLHNSKELQYFDPDIILSKISKSEIFIDGGCLNCLTDIQFVKKCNNKYNKIIAFEPNSKQYPICIENSKGIENITVYPYGLWNENTELSFDNSAGPGSAHISSDAIENKVKIKAVKLDDILKGEKATFIKLDVEGAELNALKGAEQTILKYRPKLAICLYHKPEDIWEIPGYILSLHDDYKLYIRHYSFRATETVLYAV